MLDNDGGCIEDNMHDKEVSIWSFLSNVFTGQHDNPLGGPGLPAAHGMPRSLEELADALRPAALRPCPSWMKAY